MTTTQAAKQCTGERYDGERLSLSSLPGWHGKFGHLNALETDHESAVTGRGAHDRVVAFHPDCDNPLNTRAVYCRVDHIWGLGMPTEAQLRAVMRKDQGICGRWKLARTIPWANGKSTDCYLIPA